MVKARLEVVYQSNTANDKQDNVLRVDDVNVNDSLIKITVTNGKG